MQELNIPLVVNKNDENGNYTQSSNARLEVNTEPVARTLTCKCGEGQEVHHNNMICVAMRGRNPENPSDRRKGINLEQRLEVNPQGVDNTLTTVQKDNMVLEKDMKYRIRKLTPKECWRLMGYTDEDFEKAKNAGVSNSQLYKQAGNAIVKQVLMAIFRQML